MAAEDIVGKTIGELEELIKLSGKEMIPVEIGGENKRINAGLFQPKGSYVTEEQLNKKADKVLEVAGSTGEVTQEILPNTFYKFGECTALNITLGAKVDGIYNEYMFQFRSGATPTLLGKIAGVSWVGDNTIKANTTYVVVIHDGILAALGGA